MLSHFVCIFHTTTENRTGSKHQRTICSQLDKPLPTARKILGNFWRTEYKTAIQFARLEFWILIQFDQMTNPNLNFGTYARTTGDRTRFPNPKLDQGRAIHSPLSTRDEAHFPSRFGSRSCQFASIHETIRLQTCVDSRDIPRVSAESADIRQATVRQRLSGGQDSDRQTGSSVA
jgi:hypothetical protein